MLLDTVRQVIAIPMEKIQNAIKLLDKLRNAKKATLLQLQQLTGLLNHLCKSIFTGLAYLRRFYSRRTDLKQYHHVRVNKEMRLDCDMWLTFLRNDAAVCRPFVDLTISESADELDFFSDASAAENKGFGCVFSPNWCASMWETGYIRKYQSSIEYLELYAVTVAILLWAKKIAQQTSFYIL